MKFSKNVGIVEGLIKWPNCTWCSMKGGFDEVVELERVGHIDSLCEFDIARSSRDWNEVG